MYITLEKLTVIKICKLCGKEFETNYKNKTICNDVHYRICPICGKEFEINRSYADKKACSKECMKILIAQRLSSDEVQKKIIATNKKKYGVDHPAQSDEIKKQTREKNLKKYGVEYPIQLDEMKEKRKFTNLERYGVENVTQSTEVQEKIKKTNLERYGVEHPSASEEIKKKKITTYRERYGVDNPMQSEEIKAKAKQTIQKKYGVESNVSQNEKIKEKIRQHNLEKYGVEHVFQSPEVKKKINETNLKRYGTTKPMQSETVKEACRDAVFKKYGGYTLENPEKHAKFIETMIEKYGTPYPLQVEEFRQKVNDTNLKRYGVEWACMKNQLNNYHIISKINKQFALMLDSFNINYEFEFPIHNRSYDFIIKDRNILIEIDPTITHNSFMSIFDKESNGLDRRYHLEKSQLAESNGYRCIHIFDWEDQKKIVSTLDVKTTLYARKCVLMNIDAYTVCQFEEKYHIQGKCNGQKINYGLYYKGELIQVMTFGKPRYNKKYQYELLRLCTKSGYRIIGGASKMFKHFLDEYHPDSIISYCNRSKFNGEVYEKIGMNHIKDTEPNKIWSKDDKRITNNLLLQRGYDQLFNANYGKGTSNEELMLNDGWLPIYDCGQSVYEWRS